MNTSKPMQLKPIDFSKGPVKIRLFGTALKECRRNHVSAPDQMDCCAVQTVKPDLQPNMPCRLSYNGDRVVLMQKAQEFCGFQVAAPNAGRIFFSHHVWIVRCVDSLKEMAVVDKYLVPEQNIG